MAQKYKIEYVLPAGIFYSFIIAFGFLYYFRKKIENCHSWVIFILASLHLSLIFLLPLFVIFTLSPREMFVPDKGKTTLAIKIVTITNHVLNKLIYPAAIVYYESGFLSLKYKIFPTTCKGWLHWVINLWVIPAAIVLGLAFLCFKDPILNYYDNVLVYYLNYLNIFDLICAYFEFGFSIMDCFRYCFRTCCYKDLYKRYVKGMLIYYERKIDEELGKEINELQSIYNTYSDEIVRYKLTQIYDIISKYEQRSEKTNISGSTNDDSSSKKQNITQRELEKLISSPLKNVKSYGRQSIRVNNRKKRIDEEEPKACCCNCIIQICSNHYVEIAKIFCFSFICMGIFSFDYQYYELYSDDLFNNITNSTNIFDYIIKSNNTNNTTNTTDIDDDNISMGAKIFSFFLFYFNSYIICNCKKEIYYWKLYICKGFF